jgi:N4-gp56 family major capsid protein
MASTTPTNVDSSIPEIWAKNTLRKVKVDGFWGRFVGKEGSGAPIIQKTELLNNPGDLIHIQVTDPLAGAGITGDTSVLEGNEEALATSEIKASPLQYRHGVRLFRRADKKSILDLRSEARDRLEEWAANKIDSVRFAQFNATSLAAPLNAETYTPNVYVVGGGTTVDDVAATDDLTVLALQTMKLKLKMQQAKPLMVDGFPHYVYVTHPYTTFQLKQESRYESWVREAQVRGDSNPFFRGALAVIDGMIVYEHENVPVAANAGSVDVSKGIAFGAEAFVEALDENISYHEKLFDYDNEYGLALRMAFQPRRALELGSIQVYATAEAV